MYTSLNRLQSLYEYDVKTATTKVLKIQEVPSGFNPYDYIVERLEARAIDGVKVPMAVIYKKGLKHDASAPALLCSTRTAVTAIAVMRILIPLFSV